MNLFEWLVYAHRALLLQKKSIHTVVCMLLTLMGYELFLLFPFGQHIFRLFHIKRRFGHGLRKL